MLNKNNPLTNVFVEMVAKLVLYFENLIKLPNNGDKFL